MSVSIQTSRQPWTQRPGGRPSINLAHPLMRGVGDWFDWGAGNRHNLVYPQVGTLVGATGITSRAEGYRTTSDGLQYARHGPAYGAADVSFFLDMTWESCGGSYGCAFGTVGGNQLTAYIDTDGTFQAVYVGGTFSGATRSAFTANTRGQLVVTRQGSTMQAYFNGVPSGATWTNSGTSDTGYSSLDFRQVNNSAVTATYHRAAVWHRALSPAEVAALFNPRTRWEMYTPIVQRAYIEVAGGGGGGGGIPSAVLLSRAVSLGTGVR